MVNLKKLIALSSPPLGFASVELPKSMQERLGANGPDLSLMLKERNGFRAFESALHVFSLGKDEVRLDLETWNSQGLWRYAYGDLVGAGIFFAQDIFGGQFYLTDQGVFTFDPETAELEPMGKNLDAWAQLLIDDCDFYTGHSIAHSWQKTNGVLAENHRLLPKIPFVCGGEFDISNLYSADALKGMLFRANLATQIADLPDGAKIEFALE